MPYDTEPGAYDHGTGSVNLDLLLVHRNRHALEPIERAIAQQAWRYRTMTDLPDLRHALNGGAKAILIDTAFLPELQQHHPRRRLQRAGRPELFFVSDRCDMETHLQAMRAGASQFFSEPLDLEALIAALAERITPKSKPCHKILIVEDDESQAKLIADLLQKGKLETYTVTKPLDIIDSIKRFHPDLIFMMDLDTQNIDSVVLTKLIRNTQESAAIPIIWLSDEDAQKKKILALQSGADDFLTIPIELPQLLSAVRSRIERTKAISSAGHEKRKSNDTGYPDREAMLTRLSAALQTGNMLAHVFGLIVLALGNSPFERILSNGEDLDPIFEAILEWLGPLRQRDDFLARLDHSHLALLVRRPKRRDIEHMAEMTHEIISYRITEYAAGRNHFGLGLIILDSKQESSEAILLQGESAASSDYRQGLKGYLYERERPSPTDKHRIAEPTANEKLLFETLQNGSLFLKERLFIARLAGRPVKRLMELSPQCYEPGPSGDLYRLSAQSGLASEFDRIVCQLGVQRLAEYRQLGKPVTLILRQSASVVEDPGYVDFIKAALRKLQIVGNGLMLEFELPSLAASLPQARLLFQQLADLGIIISLSHFACSRSACKALSYLKADAVRPHISPKPPRGVNPLQIPGLIHALHAKIILPHVARADQIGELWWENADYIQAAFSD
jgi:DNA-binding response OmpR family regulator/EAL domain-containing protein (putative c-di-GMP-specific phosphodiesterase class I)